MPEFGDYIVYVDESGDHGLETINPEYPMFVLAFCVVRKDTYAGDITTAVSQFKFKHFGHDQVILHERDIRKANEPFQFLVDPDRREDFYEDLNDLMREAEFTLIASAIRKRRLNERYDEPRNPYNLALAFGLERLEWYLREREGTTDRDPVHVIVESRGEKEDNQLELEFRRVCDGNNQFNTDLPFKIRFSDKQSNAAGLQLADLTARPIGRKILKPDQDNRAWDILQEKLRRDDEGNVEGYGLKVFP